VIRVWLTDSVSSQGYHFLTRGAKNRPLRPTTTGRRPLLSLRHQNKGQVWWGFPKNKTQVRGKCVMGMHFF
jgi:hypothetical protein